MAYQPSKIPQKHSTPRLIARLMDADFSGIIILFRLGPYESGVGPTSLSTARTLLRTDFSRFVAAGFSASGLVGQSQILHRVVGLSTNTET